MIPLPRNRLHRYRNQGTANMQKDPLPPNAVTLSTHTPGQLLIKFADAVLVGGKMIDGKEPWMVYPGANPPIEEALANYPSFPKFIPSEIAASVQFLVKKRDVEAGLFDPDKAVADAFASRQLQSFADDIRNDRRYTPSVEVSLQGVPIQASVLADLYQRAAQCLAERATAPFERGAAFNADGLDWTGNLRMRVSNEAMEKLQPFLNSGIMKVPATDARRKVADTAAASDNEGLNASRGIAQEVVVERARQLNKWGIQDHVSVDYDRIEYPEAASSVGEQACQFYHIPTAAAAKHITAQRADAGRLTYADILLEEVSEAIDAAGEGIDGERNDDLRNELVQVAAVAIAWIEALDRRGVCR